MTISLPPELAREYERLARHEAKNRSQLFRDMLRVYEEQSLRQEFFELQRYGAQRAREKGVFSEEEVQKIVLEDR